MARPGSTTMAGLSVPNPGDRPHQRVELILGMHVMLLSLDGPVPEDVPEPKRGDTPPTASMRRKRVPKGRTREPLEPDRPSSRQEPPCGPLSRSPRRPRPIERPPRKREPGGHTGKERGKVDDRVKRKGYRSLRAGRLEPDVPPEVPNPPRELKIAPKRISGLAPPGAGMRQKRRKSVRSMIDPLDRPVAQILEYPRDLGDREHAPESRSGGPWPNPPPSRSPIQPFLLDRQVNQRPEIRELAPQSIGAHRSNAPLHEPSCQIGSKVGRGNGPKLLDMT